MEWAELHEKELLRVWREGKKRFKGDIAQEALMRVLARKPDVIETFYFWICDKLWRMGFTDGRVPDPRKDRYEITGVRPELAEDDEEDLSEEQLDRRTPEHIALAREVLRGIPEFVIDATLAGAFEPLWEVKECSKGHSFEEHGIYSKRGTGVTRDCRACKAVMSAAYRRKAGLVKW